jgi:hypothetical protein
MNTRTNTVRRGLCTFGAAAALGLGFAGPASAVVLPDPIGRSEVAPPSGPTVFFDDNALEWVQVGGGVLAGIALAGAGAALASRRHHASPHPA